MELFNFKKQKHNNWNQVGDSVMGGKSQSVLVDKKDFATFRGTVTTENFGGFCSINGPMVKTDLSGYSRFQIRLRGDDTGYKLLAYTEDRTGSYRAELPVTEEWSTVEVLFEDLTPYKWGWWNPFAAEFDPSGFETVGIQTKYKSEGPFELDIQKIEVV